MKLAELIGNLTQILNEEGDIEVVWQKYDGYVFNFIEQLSLVPVEKDDYGDFVLNSGSKTKALYLW